LTFLAIFSSFNINNPPDKLELIEKPTKTLPEGVRLGNKNLVAVTQDAANKVKNLLQKEENAKYLRLAIVGGGCNGLSYKMKFVADARRGDILVENHGASVLIDSKSALYLRGTHLDYSTDLIGGGFKFSNPNAKATCSCGESFSR
jgi:iron-sulfur cluster assembly protein